MSLAAEPNFASLSQFFGAFAHLHIGKSQNTVLQLYKHTICPILRLPSGCLKRIQTKRSSMEPIQYKHEYFDHGKGIQEFLNALGQKWW
jgi:hypothetical protein